jgi:hypothetical protein
MSMPRLRAVRLWFAAGLLFAEFCCAGFQALAADRFFLYNLTTSTTFTGVYLAPAGSDRWGSNQALNDKDKAIEPSERLAIKDIARGRFDAKLVDRKGRTCIRRGIDLRQDTTFDIRDSDLADCR